MNSFFSPAAAVVMGRFMFLVNHEIVPWQFLVVAKQKLLISPEILVNHQKIKFSISLKFSATQLEANHVALISE